MRHPDLRLWQAVQRASRLRGSPYNKLLWRYKMRPLVSMEMTMRHEGYLMLGMAVALFAAGILGESVSYGMPPHANKPRYRMNKGTRVILIVFALIFLGFGILKLSSH
jgi:hypothetical protein